jgi:hypothetical protein
MMSCGRNCQNEKTSSSEEGDSSNQLIQLYVHNILLSNTLIF